jgi:hypothetical protein
LIKDLSVSLLRSLKLRIQSYKPLVLAGILLIGTGSGAVALLHDEDEGEPIQMTFKINSRSEVDIGVDASAGTAQLGKGKYLLAHRVAGEKHLITLTFMDRKKGPTASPTVELDSRLLPFKETIKRSILIIKEGNDHHFHFVSLQLVGENGDHIFR